MTIVIVDTDVVSYLFKGDTRGALYEPHLAAATLFRGKYQDGERKKSHNALREIVVLSEN